MNMFLCLFGAGFFGILDVATIIIQVTGNGQDSNWIFFIIFSICFALLYYNYCRLHLQKFDCTIDLDGLIIYKYGNIKEAANYQHDIIRTVIDFSKENPTAKYVVKCFIHMGIYAA